MDNSQVVRILTGLMNCVENLDRELKTLRRRVDLLDQEENKEAQDLTERLLSEIEERLRDRREA